MAAGYSKVDGLGVLSVGKVAGLFGAAIGIVILVVAIIYGIARTGTYGFAVGIGSGVVALIALAVGGFVIGIVFAWLYNILAGAIGGIRIKLDKGVVKKIDPVSYAKIAFAVSLIVYGLLFLLLSGNILLSFGINATVGGGIVIVGFIFVLIFFGFVLPFVEASIYNYLAARLGGISIVLKGGILKGVGVKSYVKMIAVLSSIVYIVERVVIMIAGAITRVPPTTGPVTTLLTLIGSIVLGIVVSALLAVFYNMVANRIGGIAVEMAKK